MVEDEIMEYDFDDNIRILKQLLMLLERDGYSYCTVKCVRDTIAYLEERNGNEYD